MKFIKKVILENFQSHVFTELEFSKGLNVILGHSDSGKTAILRAIRWGLYNEPGGMEFMRKDASEVKVTLLFQNDLKITRSRTKSINRYTIDYPDGEQLVLEGFGTGVPQEVIEATGIERIQLDEKESSAINYSAQLEGPFLLNMSDSVKAAAIGRLVGVNILDDTLRDTLRDKKQLSQRKSGYEEDLATYSEQIKTYDYIDEEQKKLDQLADLTTSIGEKQVILEKIKALRQLHLELVTEKKQCQDLLNSLSQLDELNQTIESLKHRQFKLDHYHRMKKRIESLNREEQDIQQKLNSTAFVDELTSLTLQLSNLSKRLIQLSPLLSRMQKLQVEESNLHLQLKNLDGIEKVDTTSLQNRIEEKNHLVEINAKLQEIHHKYKVADQFLSEFEDIDRISQMTNELRDQIVRLHRLHQSKSSLQVLLQKKISSIQEHDRAESYIHSTLEELTLVFKEVKVCPLCHQSLGADAYDHLVHYFKGED